MRDKDEICDATSGAEALADYLNTSGHYRKKAVARRGIVNLHDYAISNIRIGKIGPVAAAEFRIASEGVRCILSMWMEQPRSNSLEELSCGRRKVSSFASKIALSVADQDECQLIPSSTSFMSLPHPAERRNWPPLLVSEPSIMSPYELARSLSSIFSDREYGLRLGVASYLTLVVPPQPAESSLERILSAIKSWSEWRHESDESYTVVDYWASVWKPILAEHKLTQKEVREIDPRFLATMNAYCQRRGLYLRDFIPPSRPTGRAISEKKEKPRLRMSRWEKQREKDKFRRSKNQVDMTSADEASDGCSFTLLPHYDTSSGCLR